jgi:acyl-coenzyme A synthetase/AMP-(fatty) acid ligase
LDRKLISWPPVGHLPWTADGVGFEQLRSLAEALHSLGSQSESGAAICAATTDRVAVAAAVLSACWGGPAVLLPHDLSGRALQELAADRPFGFALTSDDRALPSAVKGLQTQDLLACAAPPIRWAEPASGPVVFLFTGGSTGRARVWSKTAHNLFEEARYWTARLGVSSADRVVATVSPLHIYGLLFSVLVPLCAGASVDRNSAFFPQEVRTRLGEQKATILVSVPAHYRALGTSSLERSALRLALSSGAPLEQRDAAGFYNASGLGPIEVYGSTETGGIATRNQIESGRSWTTLDPVRWRVSDEQLLVQSPFLSPELPRDAEGFFATADRAQPLSDDSFELLGRADGVVKVGAVRVDLREVEQRIRALGGVVDAAVFARPTGLGRGQELVALVQTGLDEAQVRAQLLPLVAPASMPRLIRCVERLPLTLAGKRDHASLQQLADALFSATDMPRRNGG